MFTDHLRDLIIHRLRAIRGIIGGERFTKLAGSIRFVTADEFSLPLPNDLCEHQQTVDRLICVWQPTLIQIKKAESGNYRLVG